MFAAVAWGVDDENAGPLALEALALAGAPVSRGHGLLPGVLPDVFRVLGCPIEALEDVFDAADGPAGQYKVLQAAAFDVLQGGCGWVDGGVSRGRAGVGVRV